MSGEKTFPGDLNGVHIHFVGIKGTGMAALVEIAHARGAVISGSDVSEQFYTDEILNRLGIRAAPFVAANITDAVQLVVYSSAYKRDQNPDLLEADRRGLPVFMYTEALGAISALSFSCGIAGVHGKTTTTGLCGTVLKALDLPAQVLAGSIISSFGNSCTLNNGSEFFVAETCEYQRHFMSFHPQKIVLTSVESDHEDFYPTYESIRDAFVDYALLLPQNGQLIYCADETGAAEVASIVAEKRPDVELIPYGEKACGDYRLTFGDVRGGRQFFRIAAFEGLFAEGAERASAANGGASGASNAACIGLAEGSCGAGGAPTARGAKSGQGGCACGTAEGSLVSGGDGLPAASAANSGQGGCAGKGCGVPSGGAEAAGEGDSASGNFALRVPGEHMVRNACAACALALELLKTHKRKRELSAEERLAAYSALKAGLESFAGAKRRSEIVAEKAGVLIMDDYAHHPTAIRTTLEGLRKFHPGRRIVADFMSHTYTRTAALLEQFASAFGAADEVILHKIYPSAREKYGGEVTGKVLYEKTLQNHPCVSYYEEPLDALPYAESSVKSGDLFITLGAGDNWKLGRALAEKLSEREGKL